MVSQSSSKKLSTQSSSTQSSSTQSSSTRASKNSRSKTFTRRTFSISFKLMAIRKFRKLGSLRKTSRVLGINRKTLRCWIKQEVKIKLRIS